MALAFAGGLAAAAPHSVHHLTEELQHHPPECPGVLAWTAASGADCPAAILEGDTPAMAGRITPDEPLFAPAAPHALPLGRSPPASR